MMKRQREKENVKKDIVVQKSDLKKFEQKPSLFSHPVLFPLHLSEIVFKVGEDRPLSQL